MQKLWNYIITISDLYKVHSLQIRVHRSIPVMYVPVNVRPRVCLPSRILRAELIAQIVYLCLDRLVFAHLFLRNLPVIRAFSLIPSGVIMYA